MRYYIVDDDEDLKFEDVDELCDYIFDTENYDDEDAVEEWVNENWDTVRIGSWDFEPGEIVRTMNDYAWSEFCNEWAESQAESDRDCYYSDIERMEPGDEEWFANFKVTCVEEEESEEDYAEEFSKILDVTYVIRTVSDNPANVQMIK